MTILKHALQEEQYIDVARDALYEQALLDALNQTSHHFTHFVTATFPQPLALADAVACWNNACRTIGRDNKAHVKYYVGFALSVAEQFNTTDDETRGSDITAKWHIHALLGGLSNHMSSDILTKRLFRATGGFCRVLLRDEREALPRYLSSSRTGNRIGRLQNTNLHDLKQLMRAQGFAI